MKKPILLAALLAAATLGVSAQGTTPAQSTNTANRPYASRTNYNTLAESRVPKNIRDTYGSSYNGAVDTKWQGNGTDYRSTFKHNGKDMSVSYDKDGRVTETRTRMDIKDLPMSLQTQFEGKNANVPYEVKMGNNTYYSTQVGGKEMYYDKDGKTMDVNDIR